MRGRFEFFVAKKQVFIFLRGTHSTIMSPLGNYKKWIFRAKCSFQEQVIKTNYTHQGLVQVPLPRSLEISSCRCILNTAQPAFLHLLPPNEEVPNESLWKDLHISPNFWKIKWTRYYNGSILIFQGCTHIRISLKKSQCNIL